MAVQSMSVREFADREAADSGCRDMLERMLISGQHFWSLWDAMRIAKTIGLDAPVRAGIGA